MPEDHPPTIPYRSRIPVRKEPNSGWPLVQIGAVLFVAMALVGWGIMSLWGPILAVDTHFTNHPEQYPEFLLGSWQTDPVHPKEEDGSTRFLRDATASSTFFNLRYVQPKFVHPDGTIEIGAVEYFYANVRWSLHATAIGVIFFWLFVFWFARSRSRPRMV